MTGPDYNHIENVIMGEVIKIKERRPEGQRNKQLNELLRFLGTMAGKVAMERDQSS